MKNLRYLESINWRTGAFQKRWVREELEQVFIETTSQDVTLATSFGSEMQCAQACSKADCGAFYVQVRQHSSCLWPFKLSVLQKDFQHMALYFSRRTVWHAPWYQRTIRRASKMWTTWTVLTSTTSTRKTSCSGVWPIYICIVMTSMIPTR